MGASAQSTTPRTGETPNMDAQAQKELSKDDLGLVEEDSESFVGPRREPPSDSVQYCQKMMDFALSRCPTIKFMREKTEALGCPVPDSFFSCVDCSKEVVGGFNVDEEGKPSVFLCGNRFKELRLRESQVQKLINQTITHELIHAYDKCRTKFDPDNCAHVACTEIRAATLSGDCKYLNEFNRGRFKVIKQHQACVRRRAKLSLEGIPQCAEKAEAFVESVFRSCYEDTEPFERHP